MSTSFVSAALLSALYNAADPLMDVIFASIAVIVGIAVSILLAKLTKKFFIALGKTRLLDARRFNTLASVISNIVRFVILFLAIIQALTLLGLQSVVTSLSATIGVSAIVVTISLQSLLRDISVGLFMLMENEISVGDYISISGLSGRVEKFNLRTTTLRDDTGALHYFPNGTISAATNYSKGGFQIFSDVSFSAARDPFQTMRLLESGIEKTFPGSHAAVTRVMAINDNSYTVRAQLDCAVGRKLETERALMDCIIRVMAEEKIELPSGSTPVVGE